MTAPRITPADHNWPGTKQYLERLLEEQRQQLERPDLGHDLTMFARGGIAQLRAILTTIEPGYKPQPPNR